MMCTLSENKALKNLKNIFAKTGIHPTSQKLMYNNKIITDQTLLDIVCGGNLLLTLGLHGGSGECDICFSDGSFMCADCNNQITCKDCCDRVHKHPRRSHHQPIPVQTQAVENMSDESNSSPVMKSSWPRLLLK